MTLATAPLQGQLSAFPPYPPLQSVQVGCMPVTDLGLCPRGPFKLAVLRPGRGGEHSGSEVKWRHQRCSGSSEQLWGWNSKRSAPDSKLLSAPLHLPLLSSPAQICFLTFKLIYWPGLVPPPPLALCSASAPPALLPSVDAVP